MSFGTADGKISKTVWDAILDSLLADPRPTTNTNNDDTTTTTPPPVYTQERHEKVKQYTLDVLSTHVSKQLEELTSLKPKIDTLESIRANSNVALIRQHNELLTTAFTNVMKRLQSEGVVIEEEDDEEENGGSDKK